MAPQVDLFLDDDDCAAADSAGQFLFVLPDDAVKRGNLADLHDDKAKASWIQNFEVVESKMYEDTAKDGDGNTYDAICVEVKFQVPGGASRPDGSPDPNAGKTQTAWYRVVKAALKNKQHPKYKANNFNIARLHGILRSIWGTDVIPHGVRVNLADFFYGEDGTAPAVVAQKVVANVRQSKYEGKRRDELTDFVPLELHNA